MPKDKRSFFQRLTGAVDVEEYEDDFDAAPPQSIREREETAPGNGQLEEPEGEGQLTVDVFQTPDAIVIKAIVAGVRPDQLDVSITRDMVTIRGRREESREVTDENYFYKELYWGGFSRTILLPQEVEVDLAEASEKHGVLSIRLPKINKEKQTKLKVRSS